MIITTKSHVNKDGQMYILAYVGADPRPYKYAHDYEQYIDSEGAHARVARALFRQRAARATAVPQTTVGRPVKVTSIKLPDSCNHDWCHTVTYSDEVSK